jgi:acyl carrier protein
MSIKDDVIHVVEYQLGCKIEALGRQLSGLGADEMDRIEIMSDLEELLGLQFKLPTDSDLSVSELVDLCGGHEKE